MEYARTESSRLTQAANDLILTLGRLSEWFQRGERGGGVGAILIVLAKSLCHSHGGVPHHHLSLAEGHPLHSGALWSLVLQALQEHIVSEAVLPSRFFSTDVWTRAVSVWC